MFTLREPAARAYSDYRYLLHQYAPYGISFRKVAAKSVERLAAPDCFGGDVLQRVLGGGGTTHHHHDYSYYQNATTTGGGTNRIETIERQQDGEETTETKRQRREGREGRKWRQQQRLPSGYFYRTSCGRIEGDPSEVVKRSLYVFMVHHWMAVLGAGNVLVVDAANFEPPPEQQQGEQKTKGPLYPAPRQPSARARAALAEVVAFAGLCPYEFDGAVLAQRNNANRAAPPPPRLAIDRRSTALLRAFFRPYNAALYDVTGRDFRWPLE